ncbi:capsular biosynthesis protein [Campylobacter sp. MIT 12-5580]|nr:capsular biosynthesis protein [Campylobacter sp. MIT 12-5580]
MAPFFLKGAILIPLSNVLKRFLAKKYKAKHSYIIVSAVYNVSMYLKDFLDSFVTQRLDFKRNIILILVDDGSNDNSASIIKAYQQKFPHNIIYLYKENGGQASARNFGLEYIKKKGLKSDWIGFCDSDDFLDRNFFYAVERFLNKHKNEDFSMLSANLIFYREGFKVLYKDAHALNYRFKKTSRVLENENLDDFIQLSCNSVLLSFEKLFKSGVKFDEDLKPTFEDAKFINEYLLHYLNSKTAFLKNARYYYRKRRAKNSSVDLSMKSKDAYLKVSDRGNLALAKYALNTHKKLFDFIQKTNLYELFWKIQNILANPSMLELLDEKEKERFLELLDENFSYIERQNILNFKLQAFSYFYQFGILSCFKKEKNLPRRAFIMDFDEKKEFILLVYFCASFDKKLSFFFDENELKPCYEKIIQHDFLNRVFCYEQRIWLKLPKQAKNLQAFENSCKIELYFKDKKLQSLENVHTRMKFLQKKRARNAHIWLFADMILKADDNAEHLYRFVKEQNLAQKCYFVLSKKSSDFLRLKREGFKLVDMNSLYFLYLLFKADKIISSHLDRYLYGAFGKNTLLTKDFIFLQHGVIKDDLSAWLNLRKIDLFITASFKEYDSIVKGVNHYKFSSKEVKLTGLARHDALLKNKVLNTKQILIMPTWRRELVGDFSKKLMQRRKNSNFKQSEFFKAWSEFLCSKEFETLVKTFDYKVLFNPHPNLKPYLLDFALPEFIECVQDESLSLQELFTHSSMMITDYSSVAFEMGYLQKPVLYYQFDEKDFFKTHWQKGYFDYRKDGFGEVCEDKESLLKELKNLLKNECKLQEPFKSNAYHAFAFKDTQNCKRILEAIHTLDKKE